MSTRNVILNPQAETKKMLYSGVVFENGIGNIKI